MQQNMVKVSIHHTASSTHGCNLKMVTTSQDMLPTGVAVVCLIMFVEVSYRERSDVDKCGRTVEGCQPTIANCAICVE